MRFDLCVGHSCFYSKRCLYFYSRAVVTIIYMYMYLLNYLGLLQWLSDKELVSGAGASGELGSIPDLGRSPGGGHSDPLQDSCLENTMDRGARQARVSESQTQLE